MTERIAESQLDAVRRKMLHEVLAWCRDRVQQALTALRDEALPGIDRLAGGDLVEALHEGAFHAIDTALESAEVDIRDVLDNLVELRNDLYWRLEEDARSGRRRILVSRPQPQ
jgi:hypothetical protein